ncbi:MAG: hypothetical protein KF819_17715 [Labilithrix sp.]|nr:hypothetical protein [Labilithrix sp.]
MNRALVLLVFTGFAVGACDNGKKPPPEPVPVVSVTTAAVPPAASFNATPVSQFADAAIDDQPPFEQAKLYEADGQLWKARLLLETRALGPDATKEETELLLKICLAQSDVACVESCGKKLGRKIKMDAGAPAPSASVAVPVLGAEHREPDTDLAKARHLVLQQQLEPARKVLEPKILEGRATREEIRMLRDICQRQGDRMCAALCESKLKDQ